MRKLESYIGKDVELGKNVRIGKGVIIEDGARIGDNVEIGHLTIIRRYAVIKNGTRIGARCEIGHPSKLELVGVDHSFKDPKLRDLVIEDPSTVIGENSVIRSGSVIYTHVRIGPGFSTGHNVIVREHTTLGERVLVGSNSVLNGYTRVGDRTRINTMVAMPQSMRIGRGVFISPLVSFSDNKMILPGQGNEGAIIEDFVRIGIGAQILPRIRVGRGALIGAGAVVTKDVPERAIVVGNPARVLRYLSEEEVQAYARAIMGWV